MAASYDRDRVELYAHRAIIQEIVKYLALRSVLEQSIKNRSIRPADEILPGAMPLEKYVRDKIAEILAQP